MIKTGKYFNDYKNRASLRAEYLKLIKMHHPDLAKNEEEFKLKNEICSEINAEYEQILNILPKDDFEVQSKYKTIEDYITNGNDVAKKAYKKVSNEIYEPDINYSFYNSISRESWWKEHILIEKYDTIDLFWNICLAKNITGMEFAKLFELCNFNAEKMKRTILFVSTGAISDKDIHNNLTSEYAISFIDDDIVVEGLPNYNSFLILSKENMKKQTVEAWIEFCQKQRDNFLEKYYEFVIEKIPYKK